VDSEILVLQRAAVFDSITCLNTYNSLQKTRHRVVRATWHGREHLTMPRDTLCPCTSTNRAPPLTDRVTSDPVGLGNKIATNLD
jgi:hypothetical protein